MHHLVCMILFVIFFKYFSNKYGHDFFQYDFKILKRNNTLSSDTQLMAHSLIFFCLSKGYLFELLENSLVEDGLCEIPNYFYDFELIARTFNP